MMVNHGMLGMLMAWQGGSSRLQLVLPWKVLKRLPQQALQSQGGCSTQAESLLRGICTSVVVGVPQELVPNSAASHAPALVAW